MRRKTPRSATSAQLTVSSLPCGTAPEKMSQRHPSKKHLRRPSLRLQGQGEREKSCISRVIVRISPPEPTQLITTIREKLYRLYFVEKPIELSFHFQRGR